jgi:glycosyltransferase involved in cell wall biosynthesis
MDVALVFGGLDRPGGITPDLRNLETGLHRLDVDVATLGRLAELRRRLSADGHAPDVVHVFGCLPSSTIFGALAAGRASRRVVVWTPVFHPKRLEYWVGAGRHRPMELFDRVATRAARHVDAVVAATDEEARFFAARGAPVVDVNPPVVASTQTALVGPARADARSRLGLGDDPVVLMVAAHSARRKGMGFARDAFSALRRRRPDATLLLAGGGDADGLEHDDGVVALGWCTDEDLDAAYGCADVLFVPSRYEQFSRVTLEGWAHELPAVLSDGVALAPTAAGRAGLVVAFGDVTGAADALATLLGDLTLARAFGVAGRELAATRFSLDQHAVRMLELYEHLVRARRSTERASTMAPGRTS